jgi:hypothetical protein
MTTLYEKLLTAEVVCKDCGSRYGKYSVGCSSTSMGICDVCEQDKPVTEVRDWGYLGKGISELKAWRPVQPFSELTKGFPPERRKRIREQSKILAEHLATLDPIMNDDELEAALEENKPSYEQGEITLKLTEEEVAFLNECLDVIQEHHPSLCSLPSEDEFTAEDVALFEQVEKKITDLYEDHCVHYSLSPALKKFYELYGTYGTENEEEQKKWEVFRDAFHAGADHVRETK